MFHTIITSTTTKDNSNSNQLQSWTVEHLAIQVPEAQQYLQDDDWDGSTLASTPSMMKHIPITTTTILRDRGEPSDIIISIEHKLPLTQRFLRKLLKLIRTLYERLSRNRRSLWSGISNTSDSQQPSLGVMGVIV